MALLYRLSLKSMMFGMKESESCFQRWGPVGARPSHPPQDKDGGLFGGAQAD
jgi:hypothetical protein